MKGQNKRVVVAMSGGVDSSVAAALLVEAGFDVTGIMLKLWNEPGQDCENRCCTPDSMVLARRISAKIGIPFYTVDAKQSFYDYVVRPFIDAYLSGVTPNPCGMCNRFVRWDFLFNLALSMDASFLATGHYVRISRSTEGSFHLYKSQDSRKDQSYILYSMTQNQLSHALFPIGQFEKSQVREIARSLDLPVADKPDSQDLCFLADDTLENFLSRQSPRSVVPGPIVDITGNKLGEHRGLAIYTIGQRKGIGISYPEPLYVIDKDRRTNTLIVGTTTSLGQKHLLASELNWIQGVPPPSPINARTKIRYQSPAIDSILYPLPNGDVRIEFDIPLRDITPGQIVVFYKDNECLGGGIIQ